jgi:hypothetical protein
MSYNIAAISQSCHVSSQHYAAVFFVVDKSIVKCLGDVAKNWKNTLVDYLDEVRSFGACSFCHVPTNALGRHEQLSAADVCGTL